MCPETKFPSFLAWIGAVLMLVGLSSGAQAQPAAAPGLFTVSDVHIDETAETASAARAVALREGQREAFSRLVARLTTAEDRARIAPIERQTLDSVVQDLQIENERTSNVRYLADLTVTFRADAVRAYFRDRAIAYAATRSRPLLVLPVMQRGDGYLLWDDPNPWREAWARLPVRDGLVPMIVPFGDLADFADVNAQEAVDGDREALSRISARYGTGDVLVAVAQVEGAAGEEGTEPARVTVAATQVGEGTTPSVIEAFDRAEGEDVDALMTRAAESTADRIESAWKEANLIRFGETGTLRAAVPVSGLQDWTAVREGLAATAIISHFRLIGLTRDAADVEIVYLGSEAQLGDALAQKNLLLERTDVTVSGPPFAAAPVPEDRPSHVLRLRGR